MTGLIVDSFAGGGGASTGIAWALGRDPDVAINHDPEALAMHRANHPGTEHLCQDVWQVDPAEIRRRGPIALLWASPDCKHFSKAKGGKPVEKNIRDLAWVVVRWAERARPAVIMLENVEEFRDWGPLILSEDGRHRPCPVRKGEEFNAWVAALQAQGYAVEWRTLRAADYGAPTIRRRLFLIARCDGLPIVWPEPTHAKGGAGGLPPWRAAAECIDWSIPCTSIFGRPRPLAEKTMARIARGVWRYVIGAASPFIVPMTHSGDVRVHPIGEPLRTITTAHRGEHALVAPTLIQTGYGERPGQAPRALDLGLPLGTVVGGGTKHALVAAFLAKHYGGHETPGASAEAPFSVVTAKDHHALVTSHLMHFKGSCRDGRAQRDPMWAVEAEGGKIAEVRAFLAKYYGTGGQDQDVREPLHTVPTKARFAIVTVAGVDYAIADIGMRMLTPRELFRAQGFPDSYVIEAAGPSGKPLTKTAQIRMCGNSVVPHMAAALVGANLAPAVPARAAA